MGIPFEMVGKLTIGKETERFKPYEEATYTSGWVKRKLNFNVIAGNNRHMLTIEGGSFKDGHGDVHLFSKGSIDSSGNKVKGEKFKIPFKDRLTSPRLVEVAEFRKFVVDLEQPNRRYLLEKADEKIKHGDTLTDEELKAVSLTSENEVSEALEKSKKKRHEFVAEWDFAEYVNKLIASDKYKDKKFKITGEKKYTYSEKNGKYYEHFTPSRIYLAKDDEPTSSTATVTLLYNKDSLDDGSLADKGKYYVNGFVFEYDNNRKANIPCPITVVVNKAPDDADDKTKKTNQLYVKQFTVSDDTWKQLGVEVNLLNGAQKVEIDESMLTELQQDLLLLGEITMDDIRKELGQDVYGERVQENVFVKLARGYTKGRQDTVYNDDDFVIKPIEEDELSEEVENLFDTEDEDDL